MESKSGFTRPQGTRKVDYLTSIEKANNPNVGPGSYDPSKPWLQAASNTDWSLGPERFRDERADKLDPMNIIPNQSPHYQNNPQQRRSKLP